MARPNPIRSEKERLIAAIEASRRTVRDDLQTLARRASAPSRVARLLRSAPAKAAVTSAALGLASSLLLGNRTGPARHRPPLSALVRRLLKMAREAENHGGQTPPTPRFSKLQSLLEEWLKAPK